MKPVAKKPGEISKREVEALFRLSQAHQKRHDCANWHREPDEFGNWSFRFCVVGTGLLTAWARANESRQIHILFDGIRAAVHDTFPAGPSPTVRPPATAGSASPGIHLSPDSKLEIAEVLTEVSR